MKRMLKGISVKNLILPGTLVLAMLIALILKLISVSYIDDLGDITVSKKWGSISKATRISIFLSEDSNYVYYDIRSFEETIKKKLLESSITSESENENARLWVDAYSTYGEVGLEGKAGKYSPKTYAVGGDFFLFHPLKLINGNYFSGADVMQDYILLDEDSAWHLFGSTDIVGQQVWCNNTPFLVLGVYEREEGKLNDAAGNNKSTAYVSYDSYSKLQSFEGGAPITCLEFLMPNPVKGFGFNMISENFKMDEDAFTIVENTTRFDFLNLWKVIGGFGKRSMSTSRIIFPYWENVSRGFEDILALVMLIRCILYLYSMVIVVVYAVKGIKMIPFSKIKQIIANRYEEFERSDYRKIKTFFKKNLDDEEEL